MKCPIDNAELVLSERQNIEIDYCPQCRGIWLDRGELDKIIERLEREGPTRSSEREPQYPQHQERQKYDDDYRGEHGHRKKRRESWLGDLFD